ncbi:hypothetical protein K431DRAFT_169146 [Polychaeton citri CBS 116435]|uniref:Secreted protein n=1 Tax=Polychaeton citri CBS 116435 TaxID=1314669 RepID=A0A9P4PZT3_9PEZI|nr:hypothetical protein K431DRAFT_169146 [Polychaeton citri CBS 116435]
MLRVACRGTVAALMAVMMMMVKKNQGGSLRQGSPEKDSGICVLERSLTRTTGLLEAGRGTTSARRPNDISPFPQ